MQTVQSISYLDHKIESLSDGGHIVVLDPGATLNAEATAMLQALHSRSTGGIFRHLEVLAEKGPDNFMSTFYVGYGHKSIGDCGTAVVFIEGISMLAAKAIQDSRLYNGQESSTRYIDFANQRFANPLTTREGDAVQETWRAFYLQAVQEMKTVLPERYPIQEGEIAGIYQKAIAARAFDITRGFLPAGATTNVAWSSTLRQMADRVLQLRHHPLIEVQEIGQKLEQALLQAYPNSFSDKRYEATERYLAQAKQAYYYHDSSCPEFAWLRDDFDHGQLSVYSELLRERPAHTELPKWLGVYGRATIQFTLDFGSFRDLQRHRALAQRMPLLTPDLGFHTWYLNELSTSLRQRADEMLTEQSESIQALKAPPEVRQYYLPMGYRVSNLFAADLPSLVYLVELRATSKVHPTLVERMVQLCNAMSKHTQDLALVLHLDPDPGRFNVKRGEDDIVERV